MFRFIISMLASVLALGVQAAELSPDILAKSTTEEVLAILKADKDIQKGLRARGGQGAPAF